jgi:hypothetical protein
LRKKGSSVVEEYDTKRYSYYHVKHARMERDPVIQEKGYREYGSTFKGVTRE